MKSLPISQQAKDPYSDKQLQHQFFFFLFWITNHFCITFKKERKSEIAIIWSRLQLHKYKTNFKGIMWSQKVIIPSSIGGHFPDIPKFYGLILSIWNEITTISTAVNKCNAFKVSRQDPCWLIFSSQATSVPHLHTGFVYITLDRSTYLPQAAKIGRSTVDFCSLGENCNWSHILGWKSAIDPRA